MKNMPCPLCQAPAQMFYLPQNDSQLFDCPRCKRFRIANKVLRFIEENPTVVADRLPLVSRAAAASKEPLVIRNDIDIANIAASQETAEDPANT